MSIEVSTVLQFLANWVTPEPAEAVAQRITVACSRLVCADGPLYDWAYLPDGAPRRVGPLVVTAMAAAVRGADPWLQAWQKAVAAEGDVRLFLGYSCYLDMEHYPRGGFRHTTQCATCLAHGMAGTLMVCPECGAAICRHCLPKHTHPAPVPSPARARTR